MDRTSRYTVFACQSTHTLSGSASTADLRDLLVSQLCEEYQLTARTATFFDAVNDIIQICSKKQMVRAYTVSNIAVMQDMFPLWDETIHQNPGNSMYQPDASKRGECRSISTLVERSSPFPTRLCFTDSRPKPVCEIFQGDLFWIWAVTNPIFLRTSNDMANARTSHGGKIGCFPTTTLAQAYRYWSGVAIAPERTRRKPLFADTMRRMTADKPLWLACNRSGFRVIKSRREGFLSAPALAEPYRNFLACERVASLSQYGEWHFGHTVGLSGRRGHHSWLHRRQYRKSTLKGRAYITVRMIDYNIPLSSWVVK